MEESEERSETVRVANSLQALCCGMESRAGAAVRGALGTESFYF